MRIAVIGDADLVVLGTEWQEYAALPWAEFVELRDGSSMPDLLRTAGGRVISLGWAS